MVHPMHGTEVHDLRINDIPYLPESVNGGEWIKMWHGTEVKMRYTAGDVL